MRAEKSPFGMFNNNYREKKVGKIFKYDAKKSQKKFEFIQGLLKIGQGVIFNHSL